MKIKVHSKEYEVIRNIKDAINEEEINEKFTDYFDDFDYILGDYSYGKLRLKGFNDKENKNFKPYNDIEELDKYLKENCAFGCHYFVISKAKHLK